MNQASPACPNCRLPDKTYKVSLLFLESTARLNHHQDGNQPELDGVLLDYANTGSQTGQNQLLARFIKYFSPPVGKKHSTRRIHPDSMVVFFALLILLMVYQVAVSQPGQLPIILVLLLGSIMAYLLTRKAVVRRFEDRVRQEEEENARIETAMTNWMRLYFCSRDKGVFDPDQNRFAPLEQTSELLKSA